MPDFASSGGFPFGGAGGGGMPGGGTRTFHFSSGGGPSGAFSFSDPESIFANFFRNSAGMSGGGGDDEAGGIPGFGNFDSSGFGGTRAGSKRAASGRYDSMRAPTPEVTVLERPLPVSLEDIYAGTTKKMKIKRKKFDPTSGKRESEDRILEVPIKPGLKAGSKIKFKDVGDQVEGGTQDLHFILEEVSRPFSS
jgi:DnaJ homolog subfamily B member 4